MKKNNIIPLIIGLLLGFFAIGGIGLHYYQSHYIHVSLKPTKQTETTQILNNTSGGWYQLYSYYLVPDTLLSAEELYLAPTDATGYTYPLALLEFNLASYAHGKLDSYAIKNIHKVLRLFENTDSKVVIRFLYDWDGQGYEKEPKQIQIIQKHMKQVGNVLKEYKDLIYTTQGIFVGSWAEMHHSRYLSPEDMTTLLLTFAQATDPSTYLAVRTPDQYNTIMEQLKKHPDQYETYGITIDSLKKRLGLYNDGMLGSISDTGTYHNVDAAITTEQKKNERQKALSFQNKLCTTVPNGGEVLNPNPYNDLSRAIKDMAKIHVSYLNQTYDEKVIQKWKETAYTPKNSIYSGMSGYDYITRHLGSRLVLRQTTLSYEAFQKGDAKGTITLENVGFANEYFPKDLKISLVNQKSGKESFLVTANMTAGTLNGKKVSQKVLSDYDCRNWHSQKKSTFSYSFSPFSLADGEYTLLLRLTDSRTKKNVWFANDTYDSTLSGYTLGTITIKR